MTAMDGGDVPRQAHDGIIVCSDRRLRPALDRLYNNGRRVIVSTAGADVRSVAATVRALTGRGVRRWTVLTHTDSSDIAKGCGWAARLEVEVQAKLQKTPLPHYYIDPEVTDHFISIGATDRVAIESQNLSVQNAALRELLASPRAHVEPGTILDTSTIFTEDLLGHVLVVTTPSAHKYSSLIAPLNEHGSSAVDRYNTYYAQVTHLSEAIANARLFTTLLHIKDVRLVPIGHAEHRMMTEWLGRLKQEPFMRGVGATLVPLRDHHGRLGLLAHDGRRRLGRR
jgi:hypothetical protein